MRDGAGLRCRKVWKKTRDDKYLVLIPFIIPLCLYQSNRLLRSMQIIIFYSYANHSGTERKRLLIRNHNFPSRNREEGEEGREREERKTNSFLLSINPSFSNPREEIEKGTGIDDILDFTPPTKGLHGGPLETLPKRIPVTLVKYLRRNQEQKGEGEIVGM